MAQNGIESSKPEDPGKAMYVRTIKAVDENTIMQWVVRESYRESVDDLTHLVAKVKASNQKKNGVREELKEVRQIVSGRMVMQDYLLELEVFRVELILASAEKIKRISSPEQKISGSELNAIVRNIINRMGYKYGPLTTKAKIDIPDRIPIGKVTSLGSLNSYMEMWEQKLSSMEEEEQLENLDLQNMLKKQQELLQLMANVSKLCHDTASSIIKRMK